MIHALALVVLVWLSGCAGLRRDAVGPTSRPWRHRALLDNERPVVVEVDWVEGSLPRRRALGILERRLELYLAGRVTLVMDDEIPRAAWDATPGGSAGVAALTRGWSSQLSGAPLALPEGTLAEGEEPVVLYVLSAPRFRRFRGYFWPDGRLRDDIEHPIAALFTEEINGILWVTRARQEAVALVHEIGHGLGLVTDDGHRASGAHCTNGWCLMYDGVGKESLLIHFVPTLFTGYLPTHFCRQCRADLYRGENLPPGHIRAADGSTRPARAEDPGCSPDWSHEHDAAQTSAQNEPEELGPEPTHDEAAHE